MSRLLTANCRQTTAARLPVPKSLDAFVNCFGQTNKLEGTDVIRLDCRLCQSPGNGKGGCALRRHDSRNHGSTYQVVKPETLLLLCYYTGQLYIVVLAFLWESGNCCTFCHSTNKSRLLAGFASVVT